MYVHVGLPAGEEAGDRGALYDGGTRPIAPGIRYDRPQGMLDLAGWLIGVAVVGA